MNGLSIWSYKTANSVVVFAPMRLARGFLNFLADLVGVVHVVQGRCLFLGLRLGESRLGSHEDPWICRLHDKRLLMRPLQEDACDLTGQRILQIHRTQTQQLVDGARNGTTAGVLVRDRARFD